MSTGYIPLDDWRPFRRFYAYMDTAEPYRADGLFRKYGIRVKFKKQWQATDGRYCIVFCSVPKKQARLFEIAMEELHRHLLLLGCDDYVQRWQKIVKPIKDGDCYNKTDKTCKET